MEFEESSQDCEELSMSSESDIGAKKRANVEIYLASCSFDGYLKIWDGEDNFRPVFEFFSSKKWVYSLTFEPSTLCLFCNAEGKHFPQKILYIQPNKIVPRKYNFFTENIL